MVTLTAIVACTLMNYQQSHCVPPELWTMEVVVCEYKHE